MKRLTRRNTPTFSANETESQNENDASEKNVSVCSAGGGVIWDLWLGPGQGLEGGFNFGLPPSSSHSHLCHELLFSDIDIYSRPILKTREVRQEGRGRSHESIFLSPFHPNLFSQIPYRISVILSLISGGFPAEYRAGIEKKSG